MWIVYILAAFAIALGVTWIFGLIRRAVQSAKPIHLPDSKPAEMEASDRETKSANDRASDVLRASPDELRRRVDELRAKGRDKSRGPR